MAYQMQSLMDFHCRRCKNKNPHSLSMSWMTDDLICPSCKAKEKNHKDYGICKRVEKITLESYDKWSYLITLQEVLSDKTLYVGEFEGKRFLFKSTERDTNMFMFIKIIN